MFAMGVAVCARFCSGLLYGSEFSSPEKKKNLYKFSLLLENPSRGIREGTD